MHVICMHDTLLSAHMHGVPGPHLWQRGPLRRQRRQRRQLRRAVTGRTRPGPAARRASLAAGSIISDGGAASQCVRARQAPLVFSAGRPERLRGTECPPTQKCSVVQCDAGSSKSMGAHPPGMRAATTQKRATSAGVSLAHRCGGSSPNVMCAPRAPPLRASRWAPAAPLPEPRLPPGPPRASAAAPPAAPPSGSRPPAAGPAAAPAAARRACAAARAPAAAAARASSLGALPRSPAWSGASSADSGPPQPRPSPAAAAATSPAGQLACARHARKSEEA